MIQLVVGAAAGYVLGTKAGRRRYEQLRRGYQTAVNSEVTRKAMHAGRKAIANRLDPDPRMHEIRDLNSSTKSTLGEGTTIIESDHEHPNDRIPEDFSSYGHGSGKTAAGKNDVNGAKGAVGRAAGAAVKGVFSRKKN